MAEQREQRLLRSVLDRLEDGNIGGAQVLLRRRLDCLAQQAKQVAAREEEARRRARTARVVSLERPLLLAIIEVVAESFATHLNAHALALLRRTCHGARRGGLYDTQYTTSLAALPHSGL